MELLVEHGGLAVAWNEDAGANDDAGGVVDWTVSAPLLW